MVLGSDALFWYTWGHLRKARFPRVFLPKGQRACGFARSGVRWIKE